jgi:hypothetical protein
MPALTPSTPPDCGHFSRTIVTGPTTKCGQNSRTTAVKTHERSHKAHRREHLGYAGRRVPVSRKWSGKTLADHRADRKTWLLATLGQTATDSARYAWEPVAPGDPDHMEHARRLLHVVADRQRWKAALAEARRREGIDAPADLSATGRVA